MSSPPRGQTEFQVNLKLGLTPCPLVPPRQVFGLRFLCIFKPPGSLHFHAAAPPEFPEPSRSNDHREIVTIGLLC